MTSIWTETTSMPHFAPLSGDCKTDVLIVGGGMAGILCAKMLQNAGIDYILIEANRIGSGITKNTTAKITAQHGLIYHKLVNKLGAEQAGLYLQANLNAVEIYRQLCKEMTCDFESQDSFVYTRRDPKIIEKELSALETLEFPAEYTENLPLPFPTAGAVCFPNQFQFHPLKFLCALSKDLNIREDTKLLELAPGMAMTNRGTIRAEKIIIATHFPILNKHGSYFLKQYQHRSYVLALEGAPLPGGMYVDANKKGLSFRSYGDKLLLGGGSHRTGKKGGNWAELESFTQTQYPQATIQHRWATQDCMTLDGIPYIGQYSAQTPNLYVATGFNKWGMTSSMVAAQLLSDLVQSKQNACEVLFSPSRSILTPQLAFNSIEALSNLLRIAPKRCPHMGCALKWNRAERSWDCPCHGSRFEENGKLIDNPATDDLNS